MLVLVKTYLDLPSLKFCGKHELVAILPSTSFMKMTLPEYQSLLCCIVTHMPMLSGQIHLVFRELKYYMNLNGRVDIYRDYAAGIYVQIFDSTNSRSKLVTRPLLINELMK